jgi:glycerate kinase
MADGGEGTLDAVGGTPHRTTVTGPLGGSVEAQWSLLEARAGEPGPTAVIEMARAAGRQLVPSPVGDEPLRASTTGVGELVVAAMAAGAVRIVVAVGGSATTDGGWGAVEVLGSPETLEGVEVVVASDVSTGFLDAATIFGPQKGATQSQVDELTDRLWTLAARYRAEFGVAVDTLAGAGAAGGLAGGLAALGARIVPGFNLVAELVDLPGRLAGADLVVTGEGHLDPPSFAGKVVGGVVSLVAGSSPVLCVVGDTDAGMVDHLPESPGDLEIVSLVARAGPERARRDTVGLIEQIVVEHLGSR